MHTISKNTLLDYAQIIHIAEINIKKFYLVINLLKALKSKLTFTFGIIFDSLFRHKAQT